MDQDAHMNSKTVQDQVGHNYSEPDLNFALSKPEVGRAIFDRAATPCAGMTLQQRGDY